MKIPGRLIAAVLAAGLGIGAWSVLGPTDGAVDPSKAPGALAGGAPMVEVRIPAELSSGAATGKRMFEAKCAACHGANAAGQAGLATPLVHKIYEPNHHSDMAFVLAAKNGVRAHHWKFGSMPAVEGLTDGDVKLIARYVRELQRENGIN